MNWHERALAFPCVQDTLVGLATLPEQPCDLGLLIVVGGPQYRAGSHRMFVSLARSAAEAGFASLRFDVRGMGDSTGAQRSFEDLSTDIGAALEALQAAAPQVKRVMLWGLCDGASAALLYLHDSKQDRRVAGLCLLNPWVRSETSLARAQVKHYYLERLRQRDFWLKLARGGVAWGALTSLLRNARTALRPQGGPHAGPDAGPHASSFVGRMSHAWAGFKGPVTLILSGADITAREFSEVLVSDPGWKLAHSLNPAVPLHFAQADHTFSQADTCRAMLQGSLAALQRCQGRPGGPDPQHSDPALKEPHVG